VSLVRRSLLVALAGGLLVGAPPAVAAPTLGSPCFGAPATIIGTDGKDTIPGTNGPDVIVAGDGNDTIDGQGGDDTICAGDGDAQRADDRKDDDRVQGGEGADQINGGFGNDRIDGQGGNDRLLGDDGADPSGFLSTADKIDGGDGADVIQGGDDQDILRGQRGDDQIEAKEAPLGRTFIDVVIGGDDTDTCNADADDDVSECEVGSGTSRSSSDDLFPNNSFGSAVSARRRPPSGSDGSSRSSGPGPFDSPLFFSSFLGVFDHRCLPGPTVVGSRGIATFRVGERTYRSLFRPIVVLPLSGRRGRFVYCNERGGHTYLLSSKGAVRLLATTGAPARTHGIGPGDRIAALARAYGQAEHVSGGLFRASPSSRVFFGVRRGRVRFVAVASAELAGDRLALAAALRRLRPAG
jgi:hypothetical protein